LVSIGFHFCYAFRKRGNSEKFPGISQLPKGGNMATVEVDLSIKELADRLNKQPRTVNIWKARAEQRLGRKLGYQDPTDRRIIRFSPDDQREILKSGFEETGNFRETSRKPPHTPNFQNNNNQAEGEMLGGMDAIVQAGDANAIAVGQALGQRWNNLLWTAAIQTMQGGMMQMQQQFEELHTSVSVSLDQQPQLPGSNLSQPQLEADDDGD
jgi:hypothetical protein